jgi:hypothetical protein
MHETTSIGWMARSSISRETRLLLTIALVATAILWVLARLRFPERVSTPNPVTPVLAQLSPPGAFEDIAASLNQMRSRLAPALLRVAVGAPGGQMSGTATALRFRDHLAVLLLPDAGARVALESIAFAEVGRDRASGLAVLRIPEADFSPVVVGVLRRPEAARILLAAVASGGTITLRPLLLDALTPVEDPIWGGTVWAVPEQVRLEPGTFLFSMDGALVGVAARSGPSDAIVPIGNVGALVDQLVSDPTRGTGHAGIEVEPLTRALAGAIGVPRGLVVTWVDPSGPAFTLVKPADVIVSLDGTSQPSLSGWSARMERLAAGQTVTMAIKRGEQDVEVRVTATGATAEPPRQEQPLGLTMRAMPRVGVQITGVLAQSAANRAGLEIGDVVTRFGAFEQPSMRQIGQAYASADGSLIVTVTRGDRHLLLAIEKWR